MARGQPAAGDTSRFYLIIAADRSAATRERLEAALAAADVACVLVTPAAGEPLTAEAAKPLVDAAQARGVAALLEGNAQLARTLRADGVHLSAAEAGGYGEARDILGTRYMIGLDAGASRHEAMEAGEAGADYVAFTAADADDGLGELIERLEWWSEIFEVPCVAFGARNADEAAALAAAGADFVAVPLPGALPMGDMARWAKEMAQALASREAAA
jgi:thiamine-phosphate pyrophosphorylase